MIIMSNHSKESYTTAGIRYHQQTSVQSIEYTSGMDELQNFIRNQWTTRACNIDTGLLCTVVRFGQSIIDSAARRALPMYDPRRSTVQVSYCFQKQCGIVSLTFQRFWGKQDYCLVWFSLLIVCRVLIVVISK